jgi:hypothetical protein
MLTGTPCNCIALSRIWVTGEKKKHKIATETSAIIRTLVLFVVYVHTSLLFAMSLLSFHFQLLQTFFATSAISVLAFPVFFCLLAHFQGKLYADFVFLSCGTFGTTGRTLSIIQNSK